MNKCAYCGKQPLPTGQRKYCNSTCADRFAKEGPAREQFVYEEVTPVNTEQTKTGAWLLMRSDHTDEQCIGEFMRVWKRAPLHVIYDPKTPFWKFVGPIWTEEEQAHRWRQ